MSRLFSPLFTRVTVAVFLFVFWAAAPSAYAEGYEAAIAGWSSYEDVGKWLDENFTFDKGRQKVIRKRLKKNGPKGLLVRNPAKTFKSKRGYCADAAHFANDAIRRINPAYAPRWIFIKNGSGPPHHWVTGFTMEEKIYVMDYGAGHSWDAMNGIHGPYKSLDEYADFLSSLKIRGFSVDFVKWRDMPGQED